MPVKTEVKLVSLTLDASGHRTAEQLMVHIARVSNPANQGNDVTAPKLIKYMLDHGHYSPFEMADMGVRVTTSRAISRQILRHWSIHVQEFSQRYAEVGDDAFVPAGGRVQNANNRQSSVDNLDAGSQGWFERAQQVNWEAAKSLYNDAIARGIARESARFLLPEAAVSVLYLKATVRDWIFYLRARLAIDTQAEHREIARGIQRLFIEQFPYTAEALGWETAVLPDTINERVKL